MTCEETRSAHPELAGLLARLQEAYDRKDPDTARSFVRESFVDDGTVLIMGTESGEWFEGTGDVTKLFYWDWKLWGHVDFGFSERCWIRCGGRSAQIASSGHCVMDIDGETAAREYLSGVIPAILDSRVSDPEKVLELVRTSSHVHSQLQYGRTCTWPVRFSAYAEKAGKTWKFAHMHFSIPSLSLPAVRLEIPGYDNPGGHPFFRDIPG